MKQYQESMVNEKVIHRKSPRGLSNCCRRLKIQVMDREARKIQCEGRRGRLGENGIAGRLGRGGAACGTARRLWKMILTAALLLGAFAAFAPPKAGACSCALPPPLAEDAASKTAVFSGTVLEIVEPDRGGVWSGADPVYVRFDVDTVWKGVDESQAIVTTRASSDSCGYDRFELGRAYVVFAHGSPDGLETGLCTRTAPLEEAGDTVTGLGPGAKPTKPVDLTIRAPASSLPEEPPGAPEAPEAFGGRHYALAAALLVFALVWAGVRGKKR